MLCDSRPRSNRVPADLHSNLLGSRFGRHRATVCLCGTHSCIFSSLESVIYIDIIYISAKRHACSFSFGGHDSETCRRLLVFIPGHVSPIPKHAETLVSHVPRRASASPEPIVLWPQSHHHPTQILLSSWHWSNFVR